MQERDTFECRKVQEATVVTKRLKIRFERNSTCNLFKELSDKSYFESQYWHSVRGPLTGNGVRGSPLSKLHQIVLTLTPRQDCFNQGGGITITLSRKLRVGGSAPRSRYGRKS